MALASLREAETLAGLHALPDAAAVVRAAAADEASAAAVAAEQEARRQCAAWRDKFETLQHEASALLTPSPYLPYISPISPLISPISRLYLACR